MTASTTPSPSLREIRQILVEKQVEMSDAQDGPLYFLIEAMLMGIRQFMTYEELLRRNSDAPPHPRFDKYRLPEHRQGYFDGLELLRGHLSRCLGQISAVAGMNTPKEGLIANYQGPWDEQALSSRAGETGGMKMIPPVSVDLLMLADRKVTEDHEAGLPADPTASVVSALHGKCKVEEMIAIERRMVALAHLIVQGDGKAWTINVEGKEYTLVHGALIRAAATCASG